MLQSFSGACVRRVIDRSYACVPEHAHDWPVLSLFVIGSYLNETEVGTKFVSGPSAVFYRAGARHRNTTAAVGFEQIEIEFDPSWIGPRWLPSLPVVQWVGGSVGRAARYLARACEAAASGTRLRDGIRGFLEGASLQPACKPASWVGAIARHLREDTSRKIGELAIEAGRHPSWVGSAYMQAIGERPQETASRLRVERATRCLRETSEPLSSIAFEAGFCDQSHMNRTFGRVLGRSPAAVREDRWHFRCLEPDAFIKRPGDAASVASSAEKL
jgi:AraC family transcriptional regulator